MDWRLAMRLMAQEMRLPQMWTSDAWPQMPPMLEYGCGGEFDCAGAPTFG